MAERMKLGLLREETKEGAKTNVGKGHRVPQKRKKKQNKKRGKRKKKETGKSEG